MSFVAGVGKRRLVKVRHFGAAMNGLVVATRERGRGDVEILGRGLSGGMSLEEFKKRMNEHLGAPFVELHAHKAVFIDDERVPKDDLECVYNDCTCIDAMFGLGTYERFANEHEKAVLAKARWLFSMQGVTA
jgi:hypothetical protein